MCLIFLSINNHPTYKLIVAANRDEFYKRKTAPVQFWVDQPNLLAGRDLEANGTWMGMNKQGKICMVTNYRDLKNINPNAPSRGQLVSDFLINDVHAANYLKSTSEKGKAYNGFNLIAGTPDSLFYYSNYQEGVHQLETGLHGLSNHLLNTPWPKVRKGKEKIQAILANKNIEVNTLFEFLYDDERASDEQLPDTGVGLERERALSSMFIKSPGYGSRCSTVVLVDRDDRAEYTERVYNLDTFTYTTRSFAFNINRP
jgi:uncharacterized protein with NRDE domain